MKPKKRLTQKVGFDSTLATLMATGMAGLLVATRDDEPPQEAKAQTNAPASGDATGPDAPPFADPVFPPPPAHAPDQRNVFDRQETEHLLIADLLPPVTAPSPIDWHVTPNHIAAEPLPDNPHPSPTQAIAAPDEPPPPQNDDQEDGNENNDEMEMQSGQDAPDAAGEIAMLRGQASPSGMDFEAPTPQEEALWECLFDTINVPQNEVAPPVEVPLNRTVTEARLLLEVSFDDAVIDAAGFALRVPDFVALEEELVRIENGNEVWLVANIDLDNYFNLSHLPISIISLADPTLFRILDIHVGPPGDATFEDTYFTFDELGEEGADEMESGGGGAHDAGIEPCEEVIEN